MTLAKLLALVAAASLLGGAPTVGAAPRPDASADDAATARAKLYFDQGEKLYALGRFDAALVQYQKAFDAKPLAAFLFNIGQCQRGLGDYAAAIFSYRKYLELAPDAPNRGKVEKLIDDLEEKQAQVDAKNDARRMGMGKQPETPPQPNPVAQPTQPAESRPFYKTWWFWTGVVVVGAGGGVGVYELAKAKAPSTDLGNIQVPP